MKSIFALSVLALSLSAQSATCTYVSSKAYSLITTLNVPVKNVPMVVKGIKKLNYEVIGGTIFLTSPVDFRLGLQSQWNCPTSVEKKNAICYNIPGEQVGKQKNVIAYRSGLNLIMMTELSVPEKMIQEDIYQCRIVERD